MKQQDLAKIKWNDKTIDLYTQVLNEDIPPNITKQQLRTIVKIITVYDRFLAQRFQHHGRGS